MSSSHPKPKSTSDAKLSANPGQALVDDGLALLQIGGLLRDGRMTPKMAREQLGRVRRRLARHSAQMEGKADAR